MKTVRYSSLTVCRSCDKVLSIAEQIEKFCERCKDVPAQHEAAIPVTRDA